MTKRKHEKFQSDKSDPPCVQYWDKVYKKHSFFFDWLIVKSNASTQVGEVMKELDCDREEAIDTVWNAYIEASCGDKSSPMWEPYSNLARTLDGVNFAIYTSHLTIGSDIHDGYTEKEAIANFKAWLKQGKKNPIYGEWAVTQDLEYVPLSEYRSYKGK